MKRSSYPPKITKPHLVRVIERERLFQRLDEACQTASLIWVSAPGGSGKTTLLSSYLEARKVKSIWYQCDEGDSDPATFFHYLALAGKRAAPRRKRELPSLSPELLDGLPIFTRRFFEELSVRIGNGGMIVIDNFQLLSEESPVAQLLPQMVESLAGQGTLVVVSRRRLPGTLAGLRAKGLLQEIDSQAIRFESDEWLAASELAHLSGNRKQLLQLYRKMDGWIAGLVLCGGNSTAQPHCTAPVSAENEPLFNYFAHEFFGHLDERSRELLLCCAYLDHITLASAHRLSRQNRAESVLRSLVERNYFIQRQGSGAYTLHPLFRSYLQSEVAQRMSAQQVIELKKDTADILLAQGEYEQAVALLLQLEMWDAIATLVIEHAGELFRLGRVGFLQRTLEKFPEGHLRRTPWLRYWQAVLQGVSDFWGALDELVDIFEQFVAVADGNGARQCLNHALAVINATWMGTEQLPSWLSRYEKNSLLLLQGSDVQQRSALIGNLAQSYLLYGDDPLATRYWLEQLEQLIESCRDTALLVDMLPRALFIAFVLGLADKGRRYLALLNDLGAEQHLSPLSRLNVLANRMLGENFVGDPEHCLELFKEAQQLAECHGIALFEGIFQIAAMMASLTTGEVPRARSHLAALAKIKGDALINTINYHWGSTLLALSVAEHAKAEESAQISCRFLEQEVRIPLYLLIGQVTQVEAHLEAGNETKAELLLQQAAAQAQRLMAPAQQMRCELLQAQLAAKRGETGTAQEFLAKLFAAAREHGLHRYAGWRAEPLSWACRKALEWGIEEAFVREYILYQIHWLPPVDPSNLTWPWPLRIYTLGHFRIERGDGRQPLQLAQELRATQLLKLLSIYPHGIDSAQAARMLYPERGAQQQLAMLRKHLLRLRSLLGDEHSVIRTGDRILLNRKLCWVDAEAFEALLQRGEHTARVEALALYCGEFLPHEQLDDFELLSRREQLRGDYLRAVVTELDELDPEAAIEQCHQALRIEPLAEIFYQKVIEYYRAMGRHDLARASYEQCRRLLVSELGVEPTPATRRAAGLE